MVRSTEVKTAAMEYIKQETIITGTRVGYLGVARELLDHGYSRPEINAALRTLIQEGEISSRLEEMLINPAHSGPKQEETYELPGVPRRPKYEWPKHQGPKPKLGPRS